MAHERIGQAHGGAMASRSLQDLGCIAPGGPGTAFGLRAQQAQHTRVGQRAPGASIGAG